MRFLLTCGCEDMDSFAFSAYHLLFPNTEAPLCITGRDNIRKVGESYPEKRDLLNAIANNKEAFAYYLNDDEVWDLKKGRRIC